MSDTIKKIKALAKEAADKRFADERKKLEDSSKQDLAQLNAIIKMVEDGFIYKQVGDSSYNRKYIVVTEDIVFEDYTNPPKGYNSGKTGIFKQEQTYYQVHGTVIYVNGHTYYHAQDIFRRYEDEIKRVTESNDRERDLIRDKKNALDNLKELEPAVKAILLNYQKHGEKA